MPKKISPMLSTLVDKPFNSKEWVFEIKWDGIRSILFFDISKKLVELKSRSGQNITHRYPEIIRVLKSNNSGDPSRNPTLRCISAVLDGEIVILDNKTGKPSFQNHQKRMNRDNKKEIEILSNEMPATYFLFDILYLDGRNLQDQTFLERRKNLSEIVKKNSRLKISDYIEEKGNEVFESTKSMGLEGLIAKNTSSKYIQGIRSKDWLKIKHIKTQDCVIIGYNRGEGNREKYFGSLLLAAKNLEGKFQFVGHTGSGFNLKSLEIIFKKIEKLNIKKCPIDYVPYINRETIWIKPELVVEIKFNCWTRNKIMKSPIFERIREDKLPGECSLEKELLTDNVIKIKTKDNENTINNYNNQINKKSKYQIIENNFNNERLSFFSNLHKVYWSKTQSHTKIIKKDLIEYYDKISKFILPYIKDRPLSLHRYPDGIHGKSFYHKDWDQNKPSFVQTVKLVSKSSSRGSINYIICNNKETLLWLANLGCIEMHPWNSRINYSDLFENNNTQVLDPEKSSLNYPDFVVIDLDPFTDLEFYKNSKSKDPTYSIKGFNMTVDVALNLKELLDDLKLHSYVKTSGKTGLHIFIPIKNFYTYKQIRTFTKIIGNEMKRRYPDKITLEWAISQRTGKVLFDYNQNIRGKTLASIFSPRPIDSAAVSYPVEWQDLSKIVPTDFNLFNVPDILNKNQANAWTGIMENKQDLNNILDQSTK